MKICIYGGSSDSVRNDYFSASCEFGKILAERGHELVFGGGACGLMGAAARGVNGANGRIIGVAPNFLNVDGVLFDKCTEMILTDTMRERKQKMEDMSNAFVALPGGMGTLDELFEILTLKQLGRHGKPVAVLNTDGYYNEMLAMLDKMTAEGFMLQEFRDIIIVSDSPAELITKLEAVYQLHAPAVVHKNIQGLKEKG